MTLKKEGFNEGWWSVELPNRPCDSTYCYFTLQSLPVLDTQIFDGSLQWIADFKPALQELLLPQTSDPEDENQQELQTLLKEVEAKNLKLPEAFIKIMASTDLQYALPSCTASYFSLSPKLLKNPMNSDKSYFISFYRDQQDVFIWYLYLTPEGEHAVFCSDIDLEALEEGLYENSFQKGITEQEREKILISNFYFCANSFEEFLYRMWVENTIWFNVYENLDKKDKVSITTHEAQYLTHYQPPNENNVA